MHHSHHQDSLLLLGYLSVVEVVDSHAVVEEEAVDKDSDHVVVAAADGLEFAHEQKRSTTCSFLARQNGSQK